MKTCKKLFALALALVMTAALAIVPAYADDPLPGGTISVTGSGTVYTVYKMFDIEITADGKHRYAVTTDWADFDKYPGVSSYLTYVDGYVHWGNKTTSPSEGAALAKLASGYVGEKGLTSTTTVEAGGAPVSVNENGYYLLMAENGISGVASVVNGAAVEITKKELDPAYPSVTKEVQEDSTQKYGSSNDADIGQTINFHTTIISGENASNYVLHDQMDEHFEFIGIEKITRGGNTVPTSDYTIVTGNDCGDHCTFHIVFTDTFCASLSKDATIVVSYTAKLTKEAAADTDHKNTSWLTHTETAIPSLPSSTVTRTYNVTVNKFDQSNHPLAGAGFMLVDVVGDYFYRDSETGEVFWLTWNAEQQKWAIDGVLTDLTPTELMTTTENGCSVTFIGVDAENYTLIESTVPGGYTGQTEITTSTKGSGTTPAHSATVNVTNTLGTQLPTTGGMGTTVFYAVGGILVLAALALLVSKKRAHN